MTFAPICASCAREMRCRKNGFLFSDYEAAAVWAGDMFECEGCHARIVVGVGREPVVERDAPDFATIAAYSHFTLTREKNRRPEISQAAHS